jgi:transcriptional regulator with XRE-family HTH domain
MSTLNSKPASGVFTRKQMRRIFRRAHGSQAEIAREIGVKPVTISAWLRGRVRSKRIDAAMQARAHELSARQQSEAAV